MLARSGGARTPAFAPGTGTRAVGELSELTDERGHPPHLRAQSPGCLFLRFLALGKQRKEPVVQGWVSRRCAKGPGDPLPGERACHGRQAQDLQARAGRAERSKPVRE